MPVVTDGRSARALRTTRGSSYSPDAEIVERIYTIEAELVNVRFNSRYQLLVYRNTGGNWHEREAFTVIKHEV